MRQDILDRLSVSAFRARFQLDAKDLAYLRRTGLAGIERHAYDFLGKRLAPAAPKNDGKQTPFHGHPVFKAQHATATCCRNCLRKWHGVAKGRRMTEAETCAAVSIIMRWIQKQLSE